MQERKNILYAFFIVLTIAATCDLPAKALVLNTVQFNGKYGCAKCEQPGQMVKTGEKGHVHAFPFQELDPKGPFRTNKGMVDDAKMAEGFYMGLKAPHFSANSKALIWSWVPA